MSYQGIPEEDLIEDERGMLPAGRTVAATDTLLAKLPDVAIYGFLLCADPQHPLNKVVSERWSELDHRSGERVAIVAFEPPKEWAEGIVERWRLTFGDKFDETWADWERGRGLEPGAAFDYLGSFKTDPPLRPADLPCLVLFSDLNDRRAVVRPLPAWPTQDLFALLNGLIDQITECAQLPAPDRLEALATALTTPSAKMKTSFGRLANRSVDYLRSHPATVVITAISVVLALGSASVLPLSIGMIAALKEVRDIFRRS